MKMEMRKYQVDVEGMPLFVKMTTEGVTKGFVYSGFMYFSDEKVLVEYERNDLSVLDAEGEA